MDASLAISVAVKQARAAAASAQSVTIIHLCPRCVVPRIVVGHVWALLSDSRPGSKHGHGIIWWPRHAFSCARYSRKSRTRSGHVHQRLLLSLYHRFQSTTMWAVVTLSLAAW